MSMKKLLFGICLGLAIATAIAESSVVTTLVLDRDNRTATSQTVLHDIITGDARSDQANSAEQDCCVYGDPSLFDLAQLNSILCCQSQLARATLLDPLADYVDGGGHLVMTTLNDYNQVQGQTGRIDSSGSLPVTRRTRDIGGSSGSGSSGGSGSSSGSGGSGGSGSSGGSGGSGSSGGSNPIMSGVTSLSADSYRSDYTGMATGATRVPSWSDGLPLVGVNAAGNVHDISLSATGTPPSVVYTGNENHLFANTPAGGALLPPANSVPEPTTIVSAALGGVMALAFALLRRRARVA